MIESEHFTSIYGPLLHQYRNKTKLPLEDAAGIFGMTVADCYYFEQGEYIPTLSQQIVISEWFNEVEKTEQKVND